jgi:hypothetical protein
VNVETLAAAQARTPKVAGQAAATVTAIPEAARKGPIADASSAGHTTGQTPPSRAMNAKPLEPLKRGELTLSEFSTYDWHAIAAAGSEPADYDGDAMWSVVAESLHPFDRVFLVARDGSWWAMLVCAWADRTSASCKLVLATTLPARAAADEAAIPEGYEIIPGDVSQSAFVVRRKEDGWLLSTDVRLNTMQEARAWLLSLAIFRDSSRGAVQYFP